MYVPVSIVCPFLCPAGRSKRNGTCQAKVPAARTNRERDRPVWLGPSLADNVPDGQVIPRKRN